jgi:hypothetical protein
MAIAKIFEMMTMSGLWFVLLPLVIGGVPAFLWAYRRHLELQSGPWIANELPRNDR